MDKDETAVSLSPERKVHSVSELNRLIRWTLENQYSSIWVEGEISNFIHHSSGHMYFSLKDSEASIQVVMFRKENARLKFRPENGHKIMGSGRVSVYTQRGQYQLILEYMEPKGLGNLQLAFEQLKRKLDKEGLFDPSHKKPIPFLPRTVGVITSLDGAVLRDMFHVLDRRYPAYHLVLVSVQVQGDKAKNEISRALDDLNEYRHVDVIVLARGGGSLEDLWPFNEEIVARAIYRSRIPVVSAVGHEVDYTIADFVADLRAPTPSAAAELLFPRQDELLEGLRESRSRLARSLRADLELKQNELHNLVHSRVFTDASAVFDSRLQELDDHRKRLTDSMNVYLKLKRQDWLGVSRQLESLSPLACFLRGYSATMDQESGQILKSIRDIKPGQRLTTLLSDGNVESIVEVVEAKSKGDGNG